MTRPLNIGITCFPTFGGSGVIASDVGLAMAARGHRVHFIARDLPVRLRGGHAGVLFHEVAEMDYPVLEHSGTYPLALASKMIDVALHEHLDILHVHYAVPHATAAWMAAQVLGPKAPRVVTTLHGTDITLVGRDPSLLPITRFSILQSDAVTTPSAALRQETYANLDIPADFPLEVIPNFVDTRRFTPQRRRDVLRALFPSFSDDEGVLFHVSNFRPVKRIADVVDIFRRVAAQQPARLVLVGDGPDRTHAERQVREAGLSARVVFLGKQDAFEEVLGAADVFVLPSASESFGLAALEAMACGVPVVASNVGGLPEVVEHGVTGFLAPVGDTAAMASHVLTLLREKAVRKECSVRARGAVEARYQPEPAVARYEAVYRRVLASPARAAHAAATH